MKKVTAKDVAARAGVSVSAVSRAYRGTAPLAAQITGLLSDTTLRHTRAQVARDVVAQHHLLPTATATLLAGLESCGGRP